VAAEETDFGHHIRIFGQAVARCREHSRMSREELCSKSGIGMKMLDRIEAGTVRSRLGLLEVRSLAIALGLHPDELLRCYEDGLAGRW
jgi:transcriptional regulator with XRE-family HTH domain